MDKSEEKPTQSSCVSTVDEDCYVLNLDSSSSEEFEPPSGRPKPEKKRKSSCLVIDSSDDSDDEEKRSKIWEISSGDEASGELEISDTDDKPSIQKPSAVIVIDDDSSKTSLKGSDLKGGGSPEQYQISSEEDLEECAIVSPPPDGAGKKLALGENRGQPPSNPEPEQSGKAQKSTGEGTSASVLEQPRKKKGKTKNICVPPGKPRRKRRSVSRQPSAPAEPLPLDVPMSSGHPVLPAKPEPRGEKAQPLDSERKKRGPSQKKPIAEKVEKSKTGKSVCKIPGCFLNDIVKSKQYSGRKFKQNKEELAHKIYTLLNHTVFDGKMPEKIEITWNKKMLRTAGLCTTNERQQPKRERYAKIAISQKVCDSADRIRDTLIHELCHAASWLLDGIRDSHGNSWQYYAQKCNAVHPELPKVTRCHNYTINYKIYYECTQCKYRVGRYTRSLNTNRFICARCEGPLVLLPLFRKDGTPIVPHVRPFAKYVQEHYRAVFEETAGISHGDVMKKLSKNYFASKQKKDP